MPRQNAINFPPRRVGALMQFAGNLPANAATTGFFLDYDGYWVNISSNTFRTIGNTSSQATIAQSWLFNLFEYIWNSYSNSVAPLTDLTTFPISRGASATADWNAGNRLTFPDFRGRTLIAAGQGQGTSNRAIGEFVGAETHTLSINEMPAHNHAVNGSFFCGAAGGNFQLSSQALNTHSAAQPTTQGGGSAHNNMQPSIAVPLFISAGSRG